MSVMRDYSEQDYRAELEELKKRGRQADLAFIAGMLWVGLCILLAVSA